ncbi:MAG: MFS transporter [Candidatus Gracilibacteria bacterium]
MKYSRLIIFSVLILDVISIGIMIPAFEGMQQLYHLTTWNVSIFGLSLLLQPGTLIALGMSLYALCAFFSAPLLGIISDRFGRKRPLLFSVLGTCLAYVILMLTQSYWLYLFSRIVNGLTGGNISIIQAILADLSKTTEERNKNFGLLGAIFGIGFIIGPLLGTVLLKVSTIESIFIFGAILAALESIAIAFYYRETHHPDKGISLSLNIISPFVEYFSSPKISHYLWSYFVFNTGIFLFQSVMTLAMFQYFQVPGENIGFFLAIQGALIAINQSLLYPRFWTKKFSPRTLIIGLHIVGIITFVIMGILHNFTLFALLWLAISPLGSFVGALYTTEVIAHTDRSNAGGVNGILASIGSLTMIIGPMIGGFMLSTSIRTFFGTAIFIALSFIIIGFYFSSKKSKYEMV